MILRRWTVAVTLALALAASAPAPAFAQEPPPEEGSGSGRALDGYFLMGILGGLTMFIVAKSARRS